MSIDRGKNMHCGYRGSSMVTTKRTIFEHTHKKIFSNNQKEIGIKWWNILGTNKVYVCLPKHYSFGLI